MTRQILLNTTRYLTFEVSRKCDMAHLHPKCPIGHPERYRFGRQDRPIDDDLILEFWRWARFHKEFRGILMWHSYNEPTFELPRIRRLMAQIRQNDPAQPTQLFTNDPTIDLMDFDLVKVTRYNGGKELDDRILSAQGEGSPTPHQPEGWCGRGWGWEIVIDYFGNWALCCLDWRCEETVGNLWTDNWNVLLQAYYDKATRLRWRSQSDWEQLPRMCRSCMAVAFNIHRSGASFSVPEPPDKE